MHDIADFLLHITGQMRWFGKKLPKKGLCKHYKTIDMFTYLGDTPVLSCRVEEKTFAFDFINNQWFKITE